MLENPFLRWDPLVFLTHPQPSLPVIAGLAALLAGTLVLGRFFCAWVCPLGTIIEMLDFLGSPLWRRNPAALARYPRRMVLVRYPVSLFLLGVVLITAFTPPPVLQFLHPNVWALRIVSLSALGLAFLGLLAILALFARRLWCVYLCPLGALYGLAARASLFKLRIRSCSGCGRCELCPMEAAEHARRRILAHQCILCFDFEHSCPVSGFSFSAGRMDNRALLAERRSFLRHSAQLLGGLALGGLISLPDGRKNTWLLRPPGVLDEAAFLERCLRCLQCVRSCPNRIIKITDSRYGFGSLFTPHLEFRPHGCDYYCQVCQQVCPNRAIPLQRLEVKQKTPIGMARIDESRCLVYKKHTNCLVCEEFCPVPEKAVRFLVPGDLDRHGEPLKQPKVVESLCIGCGICEAHCPAQHLAIRVYAQKGQGVVRLL